jgi:hypothetical protein
LQVSILSEFKDFAIRVCSIGNVGVESEASLLNINDAEVVYDGVKLITTLITLFLLSLLLGNSIDRKLRQR